MANISRPSGLTPVKSLISGEYNGQANIYSFAASDANAIYIGDPVISGGSADANGVPQVTLAAATGAIRGVVVGLGTYEGLIANPNNLNITYKPASDPAVWYAMVVDDPNVIFEVQEHTNGTQLAATEMGLNQVLFVGTGNGYVSGWQLASVTDATPNTTSTLQVRLMGLSRRLDNAFGPSAKWLVKINNHELSAGSSGVA